MMLFIGGYIMPLLYMPCRSSYNIWTKNCYNSRP